MLLHVTSLYLVCAGCNIHELRLRNNIALLLPADRNQMRISKSVRRSSKYISVHASGGSCCRSEVFYSKRKIRRGYYLRSMIFRFERDSCKKKVVTILEVNLARPDFESKAGLAIYMLSRPKITKSES